MIFYVIGNGFDLHYGLDTSYYSFKKYLMTVNYEVVERVDDLFDRYDIGFENKDIDEWSNFEDMLAVFCQLDRDEIYEEAFDNAEMDDESAGYFDSPSWNVGYYTEYIDILKNEFTNWINKIDLNINQDIYFAPNKDDYILTFNYTETIEANFSVKESNILHIHGKVGENLIVGHNEYDVCMIYFHVNAKMTNRRIGGGVPQGVGRLCGTLVDTYNPRFGHTSVKYGIRPHCDEDVLMEWMGQPGYKTIAAWDWNVNRNPGFIPAEYGAGYMTSDLPDLKINRVDDWDNPFIDLPDERADSRGLRGAVTNGAMQLEARSCDWWDFDKDCGRSLTLMCSTRNAVGTDLFIGFTVSAGNRITDTTYGYPSFWKVQWSLDGVDFTDVSMQDINVKALWHDWFGPAVRQVDGEHYELSYEAAIGFAEHLVHLPASLLGQEKLFLKITPAKKIVASVGYMHRDNVALRPGMTEKCYVNFGEIIIGYR